jgi:glycosidase
MTGFDGIREDTMAYVPRAFMSRWSAAIRRQYPNVDAVGEIYNGDVTVPSFFQGGRKQFDGVDTGVQSVFDFPLYYPIRRVFAQGNSFQDLVSILSKDALYPHPEDLVTFLGLHDVQRFMNEQGATIAGLELAQTFLLTTRGIPMLYYGDEIAMRGGNDPDNRRDFPGGWPGDPQDAFTAAGRTPEQQEVWSHVSALTRLRAQLAPLRRGTLTELSVADKQYAYCRILGSDAVVVVLNNDTKPATFTFPLTPVSWPDGATPTDRLSAASDIKIHNGQMTITLPARAGAILTR